MTNRQAPVLLRLSAAALLAWLVPGLGHIFLGDRTRGLVCLITITATFWTGVAIGGVRSTVDPYERKLWFVAQLCTAGNTMAAFGLHYNLRSRDVDSKTPRSYAHWGSSDVGVHYTGVAGLLNLLVIFDVFGRADSGESPGRKKREHPEASP